MHAPIAIKWRSLLLCAAATLAAFAKSLSFPFVNWQDPTRILEPAASGPLSLGMVWSLFSNVTASPYQPVTDLLSVVNASLTGVDPIAFHAVNIALMAILAVLAYGFLLSWKIDHVPAVIGALIFALHPLRVEAVAWASGRSELLAAIGVLSSALAFARYRSQGHFGWYLASLAAATAAVGSSVTAVPWAAALVMIDRATSARSWTQRLADYAPFVVVALGGLAIAIAPWLERAIAGGLLAAISNDVAARPSFVFLFFVWQSLAPRHLAAIYTLPDMHLWWWAVAAVLVVAIVFAWRATRGTSVERFGVMWILLFLAPAAMGLTDGPGPVTDRSVLLASIGLGMLAGSFTQRWIHRDHGRFARPVKLSAIVLLAGGGTLSSVQSEIWSSSAAVWTATADRSPTSALAHNYLGAALAQEEGDLVRAEQSFSIALFHDPQLATAYANRGATRAALGRLEEGLRDLDEALRLAPADADSRMVRASLLRQSGRRDEALRDMQLALAQQPMNAAWAAERVELLLEMGRTGEAASELEVLRQAGYEVSVEKR